MSIYRDLPHTPNQLSYQKKRTEDRIQLPCLDEKVVDGKRIYKYRQGLERFKQHTKRKYDADIRPIIKEETMNGTEWEVKEEKVQQHFLSILGPKSNTPKNTILIPKRTG